jgi:hypothetical protein
MAPRVRQRQADLLHQVLPELAERIRTEDGWLALAATLDDARKAGHDPAALLTEAARRRELDTATSISDVLVWRLRRSAHLPALPESSHETPARDSGRQGPSAPSTPLTQGTVNHSSRRR